MILIFVTHADAHSTPILGYEEKQGEIMASHKQQIRTLSASGRHYARVAADRLKDCLGAILKNKRKPGIDRILTSPAPRCIETVLLIADEIREWVLVDEIDIQRELKYNSLVEKNGQNAEYVFSASFNRLLDGCDTDGVILLGVHASLGKVIRSYIARQNGIGEKILQMDFEHRPVISMLDYNPQQGWSKAELVFCKEFSSSRSLQV